MEEFTQTEPYVMKKYKQPSEKRDNIIGGWTGYHISK